MEGWIRLHRDILDSDVFASQKMLKIWVWCLCKANFKDRTVPLKIGRGETLVKVKRGQFIFGRFKAEEDLFIDGSTIYKIMQRLEKMNNIKIQSNNQYSIVTINNYNDYQKNELSKVATNEQPSNNQVTGNAQPSNTTKKDNKDKNDNNNITPPPLSEFLDHSKIACNKANINFNELSFAIESKYEAWVQDGWKDGNGNKIKIWKTKLNNTLPFLKPIKQKLNQHPAGRYHAGDKNYEDEVL